MYGDVNAKKHNGLTPYMCAVESGNLMIMKYLERQGADIT